MHNQQQQMSTFKKNKVLVYTAVKKEHLTNRQIIFRYIESAFSPLVD